MLTRSSVAALLFGAASLAVAGEASAAILGATLHTFAPPSSLFGVNFTPFPVDNRPLNADYATVPSPFWGNVGFSVPSSHRQIGNGWMTWSHGYTGSVYYNNGVNSMTVTLPYGTNGFYFYVESNPFDEHSFTVSTPDGPTLIDPDINGNAGAGGFVYVGLEGSFITSVTITSDVDFAIGEFGISQVPEPTALGAVGGGLLLLARRRREKKVG